MANIKIFVSCHKPFEIPTCDFLYPVQVGTSFNAPIPDYLHDNDGQDNIAAKNKRYCELTAQYYAYKNEDADYYGFFHYRRYLSFSDKNYPLNFMKEIEAQDFTDFREKFGFDENTIERFVADCDVILPRKQYSFQNHYQYRFPCTQNIEDLDFCTAYIRKHYPEMKKALRTYLHATKGYFCNQFIMKKKLFMRYSQWLFEILSEHEKVFSHEQDDVQTYRVSGYLGERLLGIYITYLKQQKNVRIKETPRIVIKNPAKKVVPLPLADRCFVIPFDKGHLPLASVLVQSLSEHVNESTEIVLAHANVESEFVGQIKKQVAGNAHIRIQDIPVAGHVKSYEQFLMSLPQALPNHDRVCILKPNGIFLRAPSFSTEGFAGVTDLEGVFACERYKKHRRLLKAHGLDYGQLLSGNRLEICLKDLQKASDVLPPDPSFLALLCEEKEKLTVLPQEKSVPFDSLFLRAKRLNSYLPYRLFDQYNAALKDPEFVCFEGYFPPYEYPLCNFSDRFYELARKTPFYELLLYNLVNARISRKAKRYKRQREKIDKRLPVGSFKRLAYRTISKKYY